MTEVNAGAGLICFNAVKLILRHHYAVVLFLTFFTVILVIIIIFVIAAITVRLVILEPNIIVKITTQAAYQTNT